MARSASPLLASLLVLLLAAGCGNPPSYPKAHLTESLHTLMTKEGLEATIHFVDHTLGVHLVYPGALEQTESRIGIGPEFDVAIRKVLTAMHRVILSSDADIQFYLLLVSDPQAPSAYLTIVRQIEDLRRANANVINTTEMFARTIYNFNYVVTDPITLDAYLTREIQMEEFLSWQLAKRIETTLVKELGASELLTVGRCAGRFQDGEFVFTLNVSHSSKDALEESTLQQIFQTSTGVIAKVLSHYQFESFDAIRLIHPFTGRHLVLPKTRLEIFR